MALVGGKIQIRTIYHLQWNFMKSNDWRHKNVARYTPGNTKILYFFNCLLDGMHTRL